MIPTVLSIAGSDPTGGAGIQADLKTMTDIGVYGAAVITCITVQNSAGVSRVEPLPPDLVGEQIQAVLTDNNVTHIKIGMVGTMEIARCIGTILHDFAGEVIYDPVMASTTGQSLLQPSRREDVCEHLVRHVTVLTPNLPELAILAENEIHDQQQRIAAAKKLLARFNRLCGVLITGGHDTATPEIVDTLLLRKKDTVVLFENRHPRIDSHNTHGTGCTLSSAFAAYHCLTGSYETAFAHSVAYLLNILQESAGKNIIHNTKGHGPLLHSVTCSGIKI